MRLTVGVVLPDPLSRQGTGTLPICNRFIFSYGVLRLMPSTVRGPMWESHSTWLSGCALFTVLYLYDASMYLIDKTLFDWTPAAAVSTALALFVAL